MFEWDARKAASNLKKHGVSFEEATTAFADGRALDGPDLEHSATEPRCFLIGRSSVARILTITYSVRSRADGETVRLITARRASDKERRAYKAVARD